MDHYVIRLPDIGEGVAEAEIVAWHVGIGDRIEEDQATVDVMTDKATVEMTAPVSGVIVALHGEIGQMVPVGSPLIELSLDGVGDGAGNAPDALDGPETPTLPEAIAAGSAPAASPPTTASDVAEPVAAAATGPDQAEAPLAAPATRRRAVELGVDLRSVPGTGPDKRVTPEDLQAFVSRRDALSPRPAAQAAGSDGIKEIPLVGLRRRIAERMAEAKRRIPHFGYVEEFDLTELEALRRELNDNRSSSSRS